MINCEWELKNPSPDTLDTFRPCKREGTYTVTLDQSESFANIMFFCWQHIKKYRRKRFVESVWGKGSTVTILRIGHHNPELVDPKQTPAYIRNG